MLPSPNNKRTNNGTIKNYFSMATMCLGQVTLYAIIQGSDRFRNNRTAERRH